MNHDQTRVFIHDLANNFSVLDASLTRALTLLGRNYPEANDEITRLKKADEYVKKSIVTLRSLREHIHSEIRKEAESGQPGNPS